MMQSLPMRNMDMEICLAEVMNSFVKMPKQVLSLLPVKNGKQWVQAEEKPIQSLPKTHIPVLTDLKDTTLKLPFTPVYQIHHSC